MSCFGEETVVLIALGEADRPDEIVELLLMVLGLGLMIMVIKIGIRLGFVDNTNMEMISIARLMMTLIVMKMETM